eukprot:6192455-Pleurochrysis_carterae.AAC.1
MKGDRSKCASGRYRDGIDRRIERIVVRSACTRVSEATRRRMRRSRRGSHEAFAICHGAAGANLLALQVTQKLTACPRIACDLLNVTGSGNRTVLKASLLLAWLVAATMLALRRRSAMPIQV